MKLRLAKKILGAVNTPREKMYTEWQIHAAVNRYERTKSSRESYAFWDAFMDYLGPAQRAKLTASWGNTKDAFFLLMETPEDQWKGNTSALDSFRT